MGLADLVEFGVDRVGLTFLAEVRDGSERHLYMGVDQLLSARD